MTGQTKAFTMIELVFVIVVLGILAAIAVPRFAATRDDAHVAKARATIAAVRSGIVNERQNRLFRGDNTFIGSLDANASGAEGETLFDNNSILMYGVTSMDADGHWMKTGANTYTYKILGNTNTFTYNQAEGTFNCTAGPNCSDLTD